MTLTRLSNHFKQPDHNKANKKHKKILVIVPESILQILVTKIIGSTFSRRATILLGRTTKGSRINQLAIKKIRRNAIPVNQIIGSKATSQKSVQTPVRTASRIESARQLAIGKIRINTASHRKTSYFIAEIITHQ